MIYTCWLSGHSGDLEMYSDLLQKKGTLRSGGRYFSFEKKIEVADNMVSITQHYITEPLDIFSFMF